MALVAGLAFPDIDPIAIEIGPLAIRWYALAYVGSLLLGWQYVRWLGRRGLNQLDRDQIDDLLFWATLGVVLGGRVGYMLFYRPEFYLENPAAALAIWKGGMSFHGGLLGVILAGLIFSRRRKVSPLAIGDAISPAIPIGLFFGRIANFINGELFGRPTDVSWGVVFPHGGPLPRHPSQLYEAGLEGLVLFLALTWLVFGARAGRRPGQITGAFLILYGTGRIIGELFREPDAHIGFVSAGVTMGQVLSVPMIAIGVILVVRARRRPVEKINS